MPLRAILWLLLAVFAGSAIGFKIGLPGSDPTAATAGSATHRPVADSLFAPPSGRPVQPHLLDTSGSSSAVGLQPLSSGGGSASASPSSSNGSDAGSSTGNAAANASYATDLSFLAFPGATPAGTTPATGTATSFSTGPPATTTPTSTTPTTPSGPPPTISGVHTVALSPLSATIAWQTSEATTGRAAYGLDVPSLWTPATTMSTSHTTTLTGLAAASSYKLVVGSTTADGRTGTAEFLLTTPPRSDSARMTTSGGAILINGQPSFPKIVWAQCSDALAGNMAVGIDVFMGNGCGNGAQLASWLGGAAFVIGDAQDSPAARAGTLGTYLPDEWDTHLPDDFSLADAQRIVPPSPGSGPRFLTLTNHFYSRASPLPQGRGMYPALVASADILGFDLYPLQNWCRFDSFHDVFDSQIDLVSIARGKPTFQWIEARRMDCSGAELDPTPETVRAESWLSIGGGAHAIGYFPNNWSPAVGAEIARTNHEIQTLVPALVEANTAASVATGSLVKVGAREHNGAVYVIAVNASRGASAATITVPALGDRTLRSLDGLHAAVASGGSFSDTFGPLEVRIYIAAPVQG